MIVKEHYTTLKRNSTKLYRTYSDRGVYIIQNETGVVYSEAIDVEGSSYTYSETEDKIPDFRGKPTPAPTQTTEDESN